MVIIHEYTKKNSMKEDEYIDWNLLTRHINGELSEEEENTFNSWITSNDEHQKYYERMVSEWTSETLHDRDLSRILSKFDTTLQIQKKRQKLIIRKRITQWSVAAALLVSFGTLLLVNRHQQDDVPTILQTISPGQSKAYLVMHDGTNIHLNQTNDSSHLVIGSTEIRDTKGTVTFVDNDTSHREIEYNTLVIPRNGEYHIVLNDGSEVWLNAESSLKFPTHFKGEERHVILSGEAYFKVSHDSRHSFIVETDLGHVKVYGTEFNVRRYTDEQTIRTTLVNGSVGFCSNENTSKDYVKIEPGYQISYERGEKIMVKKVNVSNEIAWHKQLFSFEHCSLDEIMRDVARWYDVDISFNNEDLKKLYFTCTLDRYDKIEKLLRFFEEVYDIKFNIEGKHITVMEK